MKLQSALGFGKEMATTRTGADIQAVPEHEAKEEERKGKEIGETMAEEKKDDDVERMLKEKAISTTHDSDQGISAVAQFDQLVVNRGVLTTSETEEKFLDFLSGNALMSSRLRAERAEAEQELLCQRIALSNQEAAKLEAALEKTRLELHAEAEMKKKADKEKKLLEQKFADLRQLIIEGGAGERALLLDMEKILEGTGEHGKSKSKIHNLHSSS